MNSEDVMKNVMKGTHAEPIPLAADEHGTIRVAGTRVTLESVIEHYQACYCTKQVAAQFDVLHPRHVYLVVGFYLRHYKVVRDYMERQKQVADALQERITRQQGKLGGKPCIRGIRFPVSLILSTLGRGSTPQEILADYPDLTMSDIQAALLYASNVVDGLGQDDDEDDARSRELRDGLWDGDEETQLS